MKKFKLGSYKRIIAIKERSAGNDSVGDMWLETKSFTDLCPIRDIIEWANDCDGKLIITIDESSIDESQY